MRIVPLIAAVFCLAFAGLVRAETPDTVAADRPISFLNDVLPVLSKAGCNQGTCHGAAAGKGGFKLSLRGYAPEADYPMLVRNDLGRRINDAAAEESLLLAKPTLAVPHQGGRRLTLDSTDYNLVRDWIRQGAPGPNPLDPALVELSIDPPAATIAPGVEIALAVTARFSDGAVRDVTQWSRFDSSDAGVTIVNETGRAMGIAPGNAAIGAAYQHLVAACELTAPFPPPAGKPDYAALPRANKIDDLAIAQWERLNLWPSPPADDLRLFRRVHLDLTGGLPEPEGVKAYLADADPAKYERLIDRLLMSEAFVDSWTQKWGEVFRISREWLGEKGMWAFHNYLREQIRENRPWDELVGELIAGVGDSSREGPPNFYRSQKVLNEPELWPLVAAETTAQTFLGIRLQCARCHNHPFDRWTQNDYYGLVSFFSQVGAKEFGPKLVVIYDQKSGEIDHPRLGRPIPPTLLGSAGAPDVGSDAADADRRARLAGWVTSPDNPYFAKATANRIWRHFLGVGLVEPVDDLRSSNPASNGELLDWLADDLRASGFDTRRLMRTILLSNVYRLSSAATAENAGDRRFYSHFEPKKLTAEQLLDAIGQATGVRERLTGLPSGFKAIQLPDTRVESAFLDMFGRPLRRSASCECERIQDPNLAQALELMNSAAIDARVRSPDGIVRQLCDAGRSSDELVAELYLRTVSRPPNEPERAAIAAAEQSALAETPAESRAAARREFFEDLLWALLNSKEFVFNH